MRTMAAFRLIVSLFAVLSLGAPAAALAATGDWQPGPNASLDNTYTGFIDAPASGSTVSSNQPMIVSGWVVDRVAEGWAGIDNVHIYDGLAGEGGTFLGQANFAQSRPDVGQVLGNPFWTNSGFALRGRGGTFIGTASLGQDSPEADGKLGSRFETAGYQLDFKPANFAVGSHHIYAYAVSAVSGQETVAVTGFSIGP
jgi:hypothetical protein